MAAVPETLGGCGILLNGKRHAEVAELIGLLLDDPPLRTRIVERQRSRAPDFAPDAVGRHLVKLLSRLR